MVCAYNMMTALAVTTMASLSAAHPGEKHHLQDVKRQVDTMHSMASHAKRSLDACSSTLKHRELMQRSEERRSQIVQNLRRKRGIEDKPQKFRRDLATLEAFEEVNHNMTGVDDYTSSTDASVVFSGNSSCILAPEVTDGPYYVLGEYIRQDVREDLYSDGIDMYLEVQYVDITTCEPVSNVAVDIWNANATGVYSGISVSGNYAADGLNSTYLRGVQITDDDGVAAFETIFPGHYDGRATHTHLLSHMGVTINENNTFSGGRVSHIGQLFYPEELRSAVEATSSYSINTQSVTTNDADMWAPVQAGTDYDPFPDFVYLGSDITDGLFAWKQIAINATVDYSDSDYYNIAVYLTADGGEANSDSSSF